MLGTSPLVNDLVTLKERLDSMNEITTQTETQIRVLTNSAEVKAKKEEKTNKNNSHSFFWITFFTLDILSVGLALYLRTIKKQQTDRKEL